MKKFSYVLMLLVYLMWISTTASAQDAYAALSEDNTILTFYYDTNKEIRKGMSVGPFNNVTDRDWNNHISSITKVVFDVTFAEYRPTSTAYWFSNCESITTLVGIENLKTDKVTDMSRMFLRCSSLTSLDLSGFNTVNVTDMTGMFALCFSMTSLNVSNFDTERVTSMGSMFASCSSLTSLDVRNFDTGSVTNMVCMFQDCSSLTSLDVSNFDTSKVKYMRSMFTRCSGLTTLDVRNFNTNNVTYMDLMFSGCSRLSSLDVSNFNTNNVTHMSRMFANCSVITTIKVDADNWNTSNVTQGDNMFFNCNYIVGGMGTTYDSNHIDIIYARIDGGANAPGYLTDVNAPESPKAYAALSEDNTVLTFYYDIYKDVRKGMNVGPFNGSTFINGQYSVTGREWDDYASSISKVVFDATFAEYRPISTAYWFKGCNALTTIVSMENLRTDEVTIMSDMFCGCSSLTSLDLSNFNTFNVTNMSGMFNGCSSLVSLDLSNFNTANVTNMRYMFSNSDSLTSLDLDNLNTSNVTDMEAMFLNCKSLTSLDVSNFNTFKVTSMSWMFSNCDSMTSLDLSNFNTSNVTNISHMFFACKSLTSLDISNFNTSNVQKMGGVFSCCSSLTSLDVSNFNTSKVTSMSVMFYNCSSLASLDLSKFNTSKVAYMSGMFEGCSSLTSLNLSNFNTSNVTDMQWMFWECSSLKTIYAGEGWTTDAVTSSSDMFANCAALTGGNGTVYDANHIDAEYARIDGGADAPGYFTAKNVIPADDVTLTAKSYTREYGESNPAFEYDVTEGTITNGTPELSSGATAASPVGTYDIVISKGSVTNNEVSLVNGTLTITKAPLTISCGDYTIMQGEALPEFALEYKGWKNDETEDVLTTKPTVTCEATKDSEPGTYDIIVSGAEAENYEISYVASKLTVTARKDNVTLTAKSYSREYGEANPAFEYEVTEGTITSGMPELSSEATAASPVGTYDIVISKGSVSNNEVSLVNGTLTVTKAPLTISCGSYTIEQGEALPDFAIEYSGWKNDETADVLTVKPTVTCEATKDSEPGTYDIIVSGAEAQNYEISYVAGTLTVTAKPVELKPIEDETAMNTDELNGQDLSGNMVGNIYYVVGENGYDANDQSIVISQTTNMAQIADKEPGSADVKENFNGMIMKVAKGKGLITVNVKTSGNAQLVVQVGNGTPMLASKTEKGDVVFRYDVEEDTYVYIYAIIGSSAAKGYGINAADTESSVRIYNITVSPGATGIRSIGASEKNDGNIYDLQGHRVETPAKGIYIIGGRKVAVK